MGKVRAKTLGDEEQEKKEKEAAEKRRLAKIEAAHSAGSASSQQAGSGQEKVAGKVKKDVILGSEVTPETRKDTDQASMTAEEPKKVIKKKVFAKKEQRSSTWKKAVSLIEKGKAYSLSSALELLDKTHLAKFDETVELHINATQSLSGSMQLPHGTGKTTRVAILAPSKDAIGADSLLKEIEAGKITFDVLVATPDAMPRLAKVARILGPKGLMPNPKNGTVTPNPEAVAKKYEGGHTTFKTEAKAPVLHLSVGKLSFGKEKLEENINMALQAVETKNMRKVILKSTMSPAIRLLI